jgi:hypothetical protein
MCQNNDIGMGSMSWKIVFESLYRQNILFFLQQSDWHWVLHSLLHNGQWRLFAVDKVARV